MDATKRWKQDTRTRTGNLSVDPSTSHDHHRFGVIVRPIGVGSSGLYFSVTLMIVFALWFGARCVIAAYAGCYIGAGILASMPHSVNLCWSVADFLEGLMPLALFRMLKVEPDFTIKRRSATKVFKALVAMGIAFLIIV